MSTHAQEATAPEGVGRAEAPEELADASSAAAGSSASLWWVLALSTAAVIASSIQVLTREADRGFFLLTLCFVVAGGAAFVDAATRRIPNLLTYPAILIGLSLNAFLPPLAEAAGWDTPIVWTGATGFVDGMQGFGLCAAIGIVSFIAHGLGGGDVKLLAAVGAMLGFEAILPVLFNTLLIAAVIGILNWVARGTLLARAQMMANNLLTLVVTRSSENVVYPFKRTEAPFGVALLLGLVLAQFVELHQIVLAIGT